MNALSVEELCDLADKDLANKVWKKAEDHFRQALALDPNSKRALLGGALCLAEYEYDYEQAQRLLNRCLYHFPGDPDALIAQARLHADQGEHAKAAALFDQVINRDASRREALQGKIRSLLAQGQTGDAHHSIDAIAPSGSRPPWLLSELGKVYIAEGAYEAAVEAFLEAKETGGLYEALYQESDKVAIAKLADAIVARKGDDTEALKAVAQARKALGDLVSAIECWTEVVRTTPNDENAHLELIRLLTRQERFGDAEAAYVDAVRSLGRSSDALLAERARAFFGAGERDNGIEAIGQMSNLKSVFQVLRPLGNQDATQAIDALTERQPKNIDLLTGAAKLLARAGSHSRALEMLERALTLAPRDIDIVAAKGKVLLEVSMHDDLETLLKKAFLTFGADQPQLLSLMCQLLMERERYAEAVKMGASAQAETGILNHVKFLRSKGELQKAEKLVNAAVAEYPKSVSLLRAQGQLLLDQHSYEAAQKVWHAIRVKEPNNTDALLNETFALRSARMFAEAEETIDRALRRASRDDRASILLEFGLLRHEQGKYEEAVRAYDAALVVAPNNGCAHLWKIRDLRSARRRDEAEAAIVQALARAPLEDEWRAQIICERGKMHEAREEWKAAVSSYDEALDVAPGLAEAHFNKAYVLLRLNRNEDADTIVSTILKERGHENEIRELAGWFYLKKKDFRRSEAQFKEILSRSSSDVSAINGLGGIYFEQNKFDLAERKFREALRVDPSRPALWSNLGWALVRQVRKSHVDHESILREAESNCRKAIELAPDYAGPHACLGIIAFKRGKLLQCEGLLSRSIDLDPADAPYSDLGALYAYLGRYSDAERVLKNGREMNPYDTAVRVELGNVYLQMGRAKDAITELKGACAIDPEATRPTQALALALCKNGELAEALRILRDGIRRQDPSDSASLRVVLSQVLTELADKTDDQDLYDQALREARLAINAQPDNAEAYFHAAVSCFKQDDYPAAIKHFNRCRELDKDNFEAEQNLRKLKSLKWQGQNRAQIGFWVGYTVATICLALLLLLWVMYLRQPPPVTKDALRQIDSTMLMTMSPILLALILVSLLMPWLTRLKLPGGVEAELTQPKEQISSGPRGRVELNLPSSTTSSGH